MSGIFSNSEATQIAVNDSTEKRHRQHCESPLQLVIDINKPNDRNDGIPSLIDDCLLAIFAFLSIEDLFAVRQCSRRFSALADDVARKKSRENTFWYIYNYRPHRKVLECYGKFMEDVVFDVNYEKTRPSTKAGLETPQEKWMSLARCTSLRTLTIKNIPLFYDASVAKIYEGLQSLSIEDCLSGRLPLAQIILKCKNLKSIKIKNSCCYPEILDLIATSPALKDIESIEVDLLGLKHVNAFQQRTKLKRLRFNVMYWAELPAAVVAVNRLVSVTHLELYLCRLKELSVSDVRALRELKNITVCRLYIVSVTIFGEFKLNSDLFADVMPNFYVTVNQFRRRDYCVKLERQN